MSIQHAWLMMTDLCSYLGHLQNGCEARLTALWSFCRGRADNMSVTTV